VVERKSLIALQKLIQETPEAVEFKKGAVLELIRPVRVTPVGDGTYIGGEDSPGARRPNRPRGSTVSILPPGTPCEILVAKKNEAWVRPMTPEGESIYDPQTGQVVDRVLIHINKFSQSAADAYKAGRKAAPPPSTQSSGSSAQPQRQVASVPKGGMPVDELRAAKQGLEDAKQAYMAAKKRFDEALVAFEAWKQDIEKLSQPADDPGSMFDIE
jgi:hypothetical protein